MTTVALNKKQIAGDLMLSHANGITFKSASKIQYIDNKLIYPKPFYVGLCGDVDTALNVLDFFIDPKNWDPPKKMTSAEFVVLTTDGKMFTFSDPRKWMPVR